jgi:hypothetical protein
VTFAAAGPGEADVLIALETKADDSPEDLYDWSLVALQSSDGGVLGRCPLEGGPTEWLPSRLQASPDRLLIVIRGNQSWEVRWELR